MKRLLLRMSALSLVVVLCLIAIARAQRSDSIDGNTPSPTDPFANGGTIAAQSGAVSGGASSSSVRLVGVQDIPSESGAVPPRSVPSEQQATGGPELTIHQVPSSGREMAMDAPAANDPMGLRGSVSAPPNSSPQSGVVPASGSIYTNGAALASATAPVDAPIPSSPPASGGHAIDLSPATPAPQPIQVAQAPGSFDPSPSVAPLPPRSRWRRPSNRPSQPMARRLFLRDHQAARQSRFFLRRTPLNPHLSNPRHRNSVRMDRSQILSNRNHPSARPLPPNSALNQRRNPPQRLARC